MTSYRLVKVELIRNHNHMDHIIQHPDGCKLKYNNDAPDGTNELTNASSVKQKAKQLKSPCQKIAELV